MKPQTFTTTILTANSPTINGRIYPKDVLEAIVESSKDKEIFGGGPGYDQDPHITLTDITHKVTNIRLEGDTLVCDIDLMNTPAGKPIVNLAISLNANSLDDMGLEVVPSGYGKISDDSVVTDYTLHCVNIIPIQKKS